MDYEKGSFVGKTVEDEEYGRGVIVGQSRFFVAVEFTDNPDEYKTMVVRISDLERTGND